MIFSKELNKISRSKIDLIVIELDYCNLTFGTSPCAATGNKCYNTYPTCKDTINYSKGNKIYKFSNVDKPLPFGLVKPYIDSISDIPTEIKEKNTISRKLKIKMIDEQDNDVNVDPYRSSRSSIQGSFWKKFLARNKNYKGRTIKYYVGFLGMTEAEFLAQDPSFVGVLNNIKTEKNEITIEAVDLLRALKDVKYPLNTPNKTFYSEGMVHKVGSEDSMLQLEDAYVGDFCQREDFQIIRGAGFTLESPGNYTSNILYKYYIYAYDALGRAFALEAVNVVKLFGPYGFKVKIYWDAVSNATYYRVFRFEAVTGTLLGYFQTTGLNITDNNDTGTDGEMPDIAEWYLKLNSQPNNDIDNWEAISGTYEFHIESTSAQQNFDTEGYIQIGKEIIYHGNIASSAFTSIKRAQLGTKAERHVANTAIKQILYKQPNNPFTILKELLTDSVGQAYIDVSFTTYESAWSDINFSTGPITKASNLADIYFDLVNSLNCISWQNEKGLIEIRKRDEREDSYRKISDLSIVENSVSVDLNESSRKTRWGLRWNRKEFTKNLTDADTYYNFELLVDADSEGANQYSEIIEDIRNSTWINDDCGTYSEITTFINSLLALRKARTQDAQEQIIASLEIKDSEILTCSLIKLSTDELQNSDGNDFADVLFRVIRRNISKNKMELKLEREY